MFSTLRLSEMLFLFIKLPNIHFFEHFLQGSHNLRIIKGHNMSGEKLFQAMRSRTIQQRWEDCHILRSRSSPDILKLSRSPTTVQNFFSNVKSKSKWRPKNLKFAAFSQRKCHISFPVIQSKSGPGPYFWSDLQSGSNPISTKFDIVRIQVQSNAHLCYTVCWQAVGQPTKVTTRRRL